MSRLSIISDTLLRARHLGGELAGVFDTQYLSLDSFSDAEPTEFTIGDVNLDCAHISDLKVWLKRRPRNGKVIFLVDKGSHHQAVQANAIGATEVLPRPIKGKTLLKKLLGDIESLASGPSGIPPGSSEGIVAGIDALQGIFASASLGAPLDAESINAAGEAVVANIGEDGIKRWIETVRKHHSQTYQHCLIVTGVAVSFAQHLRFSAADQRRLATAGLLHDIGKARIPLAILEKPGPLDVEELAIMRQHPLLGYEALRSAEGMHPEMLDMVTHHHEYLDGSGYPHALQGNEGHDDECK